MLVTGATSFLDEVRQAKTTADEAEGKNTLSSLDHGM